MKKIYKKVFKEIFSKQIKYVRTNINHYSQEEMASCLLIEKRNYINLEHGITCCNTISFIIFLFRYCPDREAFLLELEHALDKSDKDINRR